MEIRLSRPRTKDETRTPSQLLDHYLVEKELAERLRIAPAQERRTLYASAYEELYRRVPDHVQLTNKASAAQRARRIELQLQLLGRWLSPSTTFLEIGAGDCALSLAVASRVAHVYAVDVSATITQHSTLPKNFTLLLSDGSSIPTPPASITLAYSNQLMEHLHPEDALQQLTNIYDALAPGGVYLCLTPNRLTGPHDISRYFDPVATGLHLKEYTCSELIALFRKVGFRSVHQYMRRRAAVAKAPTMLINGVEGVLEQLPAALRMHASSGRLQRALLDIRLVAMK